MTKNTSRWLDSVPRHWEIKRMKDVSVLNPAYNGPDLDGVVSFVPMEALRYDKIQELSIPYIVAKGSYTFFANGDILVAKVTPCFENGNIAIADNLKQGIGFGSSEIFTIRSNEQIYNRFLFYFMLTSDFMDKACATMCGVGGLKRISPEFMRSAQVIVPPMKEQHVIVDYLDSKVANINEYIDIRKRELNFLRTLRRSRVNEVVVNGLRDDRLMKDSGEGWIGAVPDNWEIVRIGSCFDERREQVSDTEFPPLSVTKQGIFPQLEGVAKTENGENRKKVCVDDFVINSRSDRKGSSGVSKYDGSVSLINIVLTSNGSLLPGFCNYLFKSSRFIDEYYRVGHGIVADLWTTGYNEMRTINIPIPPLNEQQEITAYLDEECSKIDKKCALIEQQIEKLQLLKRALINEVVTGKRKIA